MISLGIFGDSFVDDIRYSRDLCGYFIDNLEKRELLINECIKKDPSYWEILKQDKKNFTDVQTYGYGGADNYWSFLNFISMHDQFDKIIFVVTANRRQSIKLDPIHIIEPRRGGAWLHNTSLEQIQNERIKIQTLPETCFGKNKTNDTKTLQAADDYFTTHKRYYYHDKQEILNIIDACEMYHKHIHPSDPTKDWLFNMMILNTILQIRPDVKIVSAFDLDEPYYEGWGFRPKNKHTSLHNIWSLEDSLMNVNEDKRDIWNKVTGVPVREVKQKVVKLQDEYNEEIRFDMRIAHMSTSSHIILAEQLKKFIFTNKNWFVLNMVPVIHELRGIKLEDWYIKMEKFPEWLEKRGINIDKYK